MTTESRPLDAATPARGRRRRRYWWLELVVAVGAYELYGLVQSATNNERGVALRHARVVVGIEQQFHIWIEPAMNAWLAAHRLLAEAANYYYALSHVLITTAVLCWLWRRHPAAYTRWRNALLAISLTALIVFWTFPVAPPRLAAPLTDTLTRFDTFGAAHAGGIVDLYAAFPSLHVAWAVWCAAAVMSQSPRRVRGALLIYPVITTIVVLATANHYLVDVLAGAMLAAVFVCAISPVNQPRNERRAVAEVPAAARRCGATRAS